MQLLNMYLPGFRHGFGRTPGTAEKRFSDKVKALRENLPGELPSMFSDLLTPEGIELPQGKRERVFDVLSTFWLNLDQIINGGSLRWGNRQMQVFLHQRGKTAISTCT